MIKHHHYRSPWKRAAYSFLLIVLVMGVGTAGMHRFEHMGYLKSFYFMSMIATAQGPTFTPVTAAGMLFASLMAFISVGVVVASMGFLFGPFFGKLWHMGASHLEEEIHLLTKHRK